MTQTSLRRLALALSLATLTLATSGTSLAQTVTGTDPCPKGWVCAAGNTTQPVSNSTPSTSTTVMQAVLIFLGVA